jgi:hypothetical protein
LRGSDNRRVKDLLVGNLPCKLIVTDQSINRGTFHAVRLLPQPGHWLVYATGGLAWTYNEFTRTQLAGTPVGGNADPDTRTPFF